MSAQSLAARRARLVQKIAVGRLDIVDALVVVLEPVRKVDALRAAFGRGMERSRAAAPMMYPLLPIGLLALVRGRHGVAYLLRGALGLSLRGAAFARVLRQAGPLVAAASRSFGARARRE
jgi:hypothetical protein